MITPRRHLAQRTPRIRHISAREVSGGFEIMPVIFIPFILAGALWLLFTGAKHTAHTARKKAAPVAVFVLLIWWAVRPLERRR